jgi:HK97 gp10 family phage protein
MAVKILDRGYKQIKEQLRILRTKEVAVGVLEGSVNKDQISIAEYAAYNEFGTEKIPSRPFMAMAFDENVNNIERNLKTQYGKVLRGQATTDQALTTIGLQHAKRIQKTITGRDILPKLKDATIRRKKGSTKTLVDTGALVNAIQVSVRPSK